MEVDGWMLIWMEFDGDDELMLLNLMFMMNG